MLSELKSQALSAYDQKRYAESLKLYEQILETIPDNVHSLVGRGVCQLKLMRVEKSVSSFQEAYSVDKDYAGLVPALCEVLLFVPDIAGYSALRLEAPTDAIEPSLEKYFDALLRYGQDDFEGLVAVAQDLIDDASDIQRDVNWTFDDMRAVTKSRSNEPRLQVLRIVVDLVDGETDASNARAALELVG